MPGLTAIGNYPEPEPYTLEACLARRHRLPAEAVCVTNGATEAIYLTADFPRDEHRHCACPLSVNMPMPAACTAIGSLPSTGFLRRAEGYRLPEEVCGCAIPITLPERLWRRNIWQHLSVIIRRSVSSSTSPTSFSPCVAFHCAGGGGVSQRLAAALHDQALCRSRSAIGICHRCSPPAASPAYQPYALVGQPACHRGGAPSAFLEHDVPNPLDVASSCKRLPACAVRSRHWEDWRYGPPKPISCWCASVSVGLPP